jgi:hypothetical protein
VDTFSLVMFGFFVAGALVAVFNIRTGRWDRHGATRLAAVVFFLCLASSVVGSHHPLSIAEEVRGFFTSVAYAATRALMTWLLYVAIEPFIRRLHPSALISWSRLLAGRVSDPAVGRDVLIGLAVLEIQGIALFVFFVVFGLSAPAIQSFAFAGGENPLSSASYLAAVLRYPVVALGSNLGLLLIYVVARWMLGRFYRAAPLVLWLANFLFLYGSVVGGDSQPLERFVFASTVATASTYLAVRQGLLAYVLYSFLGQVSMITMVTLDPSAWFFAPTAIFVGLVVAMTVFAIISSTDQKLLSSRP